MVEADPQKTKSLTPPLGTTERNPTDFSRRHPRLALKAAEK